MEMAHYSAALQEESERMAADLRRLNKEMGDLEATAESDDGLVEVTVGIRGKVLSLTIDPRVYRSPDSVGLAKSIMDTLRAASEKVDKKSVEIAKLMMPGSDDPSPDPAFGPLLYHLERRP